MTVRDDFDRTLTGWFEADARAPAPAGDLERVVDVTRHMRPRPTWFAGLGSRWVGDARDVGSASRMRSMPRARLRWSTVILLLLVLAALVGGAILIGARLLQDSPPPGGQLGRLAYALDDDIYLADWDGQHAVRIADGTSEAGAPGCGYFWAEGSMWSPDGRHLAYRSGDERCGGTVRITDPEGRLVSSFPSTGWLVSWSSDSDRVATWVDLGKTIGIFGLDGVRQALLTLPRGRAPSGDYDPVWSLDDDALLIKLGPPSPSRAWALPIDGGTPRQVPDEDTRSQIGAVSSPDGERVASVLRDQKWLVIAGADGTQLRVPAGAVNGPSGLVGGAYAGAYAGNPVWSPKGDRVAVLWSSAHFYDQAGQPNSSTYELHVVDVASGTVTAPASGPSTDEAHLIMFSSDGDRILFSTIAATTVGATSVWSVHTAGSDPELLVAGTGWAALDWQPRP